MKNNHKYAYSTNNQHITPPQNNDNSVEQRQNQRASNLELLRILAMLAIIAHHYVVNSSVTDYFVYDETITHQQLFLEIWGMWGKTGINAFILISGYFMCMMQLTLKRYIKLLVQIFFYGFTIMLIFAICDYQPLTTKLLFNQAAGLFRYVNRYFVASFMAFYAFVPLYNIVIRNIDSKHLCYIVLGLLFYISICSTFFLAPTMYEPLWYVTLYFVAAYIRLYPNRWTENLKISSIVLIASVTVAILACILTVHICVETGATQLAPYKWHLVADSNRFLAFIIGLASFLTAKNIKMGHSKIINGLAAGCFGVLLIHASSDTMRQWLWQDVYNVPAMLKADMPLLIAHAVTTPIIIYLVCSFIDHYYKKYIEPILMNIIFMKRRDYKNTVQ